ncbi:MAG: hypothetical protein IJS67_04170, partial [Clostridia bacterium]|nr:hypothetical protein [Clostridia bacterium]
ITRPDESVVRSNEIDLTSAGKYTVRYEVKKNNKTYFAEKSFSVFKPLYEVSAGGSLVYGYDERLGEDNQGLKVSLRDGSVFRLNRKIDLAALTDEKAFITLHILPERTGYPELSRFFIKVIDAEDENNYFAISVNYFGTRVDGNVKSGVFGYINNLSTVYYNDIVCIARQASWSGWLAYASFAGDDGYADISEQTLSFYFNNDAQQVYGEDLRGERTGVLSLASFPEKWRGLTDGNCYIEIFSDMLTAKEGNLFIDAIADIDLSTNRLSDDGAPEITVYKEGYEGELPQGYAGSTYPLFGATAFDAEDGKVEVKTSVYYNYYSNAKISVPAADGKFLPTREGKYTVLYTAEDTFGNKTETLIDVEVLASGLAPEFTCAIGEHATQACAGEEYALPEATYSGYIQYAEKSVRITKGGKTYALNSNGTFTATESGDYSVCFTASDFLGRECLSQYTLKVTSSDRPVFVTDPEILVPDKFIAGYLNSIPEVKAVYIGADNTVKDASVSVTASSGTISGGRFTPSAAGEVSLTFTATYGGKTLQKTVARRAYSIKNENGIDYKSTFITSESVVAGYSASGYAEYTFTGSGRIEFINTMLSENVFVKLQTNKTKKDIGALTVNIYNPQNRAKRLSARLQSYDGRIYISLNGGALQAVGSGDFSGDHAIEINYEEFERRFTINGLSYDTGDFGGIGSDYAALEIEVEGKTDESLYGLIAEKAGNQSLSSTTTIDNGKPMIVCMGDYGGCYEINDVYTSPYILAKDMIDPSLKEYSMTVTAPDGSYLTVDGKTMDNAEVRQIEFTLSSYGEYVFEYYAKDTSGRNDTFVFVVNVLDRVPPVVRAVGTYATAGKVNTAVTVATFSASDNVTPSGEIFTRVLVLKPDGNYELVENGKFTPGKAGHYKVTCYATDAFGNVGVCQYDVEVK